MTFMADPKREKLRSLFPELIDAERLIQELHGQIEVKTLARIPCDSHELPIYSIAFPSKKKCTSALAFIGGIHGLERIGTQVILAYLQTIQSLLEWDIAFQSLLSNVRLYFIPFVNPSGIYLEKRSNKNGVDLMRNAPIESPEVSSAWRIFQGHRISPKLPWYRGVKGQMEAESEALCRFVKEELFQYPVSVTLDVHSGFGKIDRLWFPYAKSKALFPNVSEMLSLKRVLDSALPNHVYQVEPQSTQYTTHGDLWDYLYDLHRLEKPNHLFLPLTLEMGSWLWMKKNPFQSLSKMGMFHPLKPHRIRRVLRRHWPLFDFLSRAVAAPHWAESNKNKADLNELAHQLWAS